MENKAIFLFLPQLTKVPYFLITIAKVACLTHPRPKKRPRVMLSPHCLLCILYDRCEILLRWMHHIFIVIFFLSISTIKVLAQILSTLMTGAHLQELDTTPTHLNHSTQQLRQPVECFEDGQGTSNEEHLRQFHSPCPPLYAELSGVASIGRKSPVAFGARWAQVWKPDQPLRNSVKWMISLTSMCLSFLICELEIMPPSLQDHWGH